jgi:NAD(P)-dependent dehydrogenase (short-subunit alcohol dehydrogenase family)
MEPEGAMRPFTGLGQDGSMDLHLAGKVVLITGGTDGVGAALAGRLAEEGSRVAVWGRDPHRLAAAGQRLRGYTQARHQAQMAEFDHQARMAELARFRARVPRHA